MREGELKREKNNERRRRQIEDEGKREKREKRERSEGEEIRAIQ